MFTSLMRQNLDELQCTAEYSSYISVSKWKSFPYICVTKWKSFPYSVRGIFYSKEQFTKRWEKLIQLMHWLAVKLYRDDICSNPPKLICHCQCPAQSDCLRVHYEGTWRAHFTPVISIIINNRRSTIIIVSECPSRIRYSLKVRFSDLYLCVVLLKLNDVSY
jgi:hypothetical protein